MWKKIISTAMIGTIVTSSLSPASAAVNENNKLDTNITSNFIIENTVETKDGKKVNYKIDKNEKGAKIITELDNGEKSELIINADNTMVLKEIHADGTIKYFDNDEIKKSLKMTGSKDNPSIEDVIINNSIDPQFQILATNNIYDLGDKSKASGKWKITHESAYEFTPANLAYTSVVNLVLSLMLYKLVDSAKAGNKLTTTLLITAAGAFLNSISITSGKIYTLLYQYQDIDPIVNGNYYRTQLLFFSDDDYDNRLGTISYYWGVYRH